MAIAARRDIHKWLSLLLCSNLVYATDIGQLQLLDLGGAPISNAVVEYDAEPLIPQLSVSSDYIMDQKDYQFTPRLLVVPVGALVRFPNSDESRHHVYSFSEPRPFEIQLYAGNQADPVDFTQAGLVALGCNIHDKMSAHIYVTSAPIAQVTNERGLVTMPDIKADSGSQLQIWHPLLNIPLVYSVDELDISSDGQVTLTLPIALPIEAEQKTGSSLRDRLKSYKRDGD